MPKQRRWAIKRQLEEAADDVRRAIDLVVVAGRPYETVHPDYYDLFCAIVTILYMAKQQIEDIRGRI